jgi:hypothetical protein
MVAKQLLCTNLAIFLTFYFLVAGRSGLYTIMYIDP